MSIFKCKMCGGTLEIQNNETVAICEYCGTKQTLPRLDDEKRANLYDRANHFRRNNEFDKAAAIYEQILSEDGKDAEAYWSLVLCRYGIEYVEDPATHKRVPTVNRAQFTSIYADADYQAALEHADGYQRTVYEEEAKAIDKIQKGILAISQKEEPFDVFICYKETDNNGRRTPDSVLANDLYHQLTQEGFKVFFARITLEDKLGSAYEPYIFAALNSAKVMVVLGTKPEYFNAVWVKNEWSRFLALTKDGKKTLIPAYKDMDPYYLPPEFANLQAQDMSKLGFMQDLIRGIKKIVIKESVPFDNTKQSHIVEEKHDENPLLERAFIFLEDGNWESANEYCERVLDQEPRNGGAYLCKLLIEFKLTNREQLRTLAEPFMDSPNFKRAKQYASSALMRELDGYVEAVRQREEEARKEEIYRETIALYKQADTEADLKYVRDAFALIRGYKNTDRILAECEKELQEIEDERIYNRAISCAKKKTIESQEEAISLFEQIQDYRDSNEQIGICKRKIDQIKVLIQQEKMQAALVAEEQRRAALYRNAATALGKAQNEDECKEIRAIFVGLGGYKDARTMVELCDAKIEDLRCGPTYRQAIAYGKSKNVQQLEEAIVLLETIRTYKDAEKRIDEYKTRIEELNKENIYISAVVLLKNKEVSGVEQAKALFESISGYKDARNMVELCDAKIEDLRCGPTYRQAIAYGKSKNVQQLEEAIALLETIRTYKDAEKRIDEYKTRIEKLNKENIYISAITLLKSKEASDIEQAKALFESISGYKDASNYAQSCQKRIDALNNGVEEQPKPKKKTLFIILGTVACLLVLCIVTVFVVMPFLGNHGKGDPVVALPSNVAENTSEPSAPASTMAPTDATTASPITMSTVTPTSTPATTNTPSVFIDDIIKFGTYEQDNNPTNGEEEIEWIVLDKKDGKALLISKYGLDCQQYSTTYIAVTWESCTLRNWLNTTFYTTAFDANQQSKIVSTTLTNADNPTYGTGGGNNTTDKVFLLSIDEMQQYFASNTARELTATAYAKAYGVYVDSSGVSAWWLRSPGSLSDYAAIVTDYGTVSSDGIDVHNDFLAVRPALWINLES